MSGRVLLTVDLSYQVYRAAAAHPGLSSVDGVFTGGLYGFLQSFSKAVRETGATDVVVCRDSKPYVRSRDYPAYKSLRKKAMDPELREAYDATEPLVLDLLGRAGVPVWAEPGFEADDLAALLVRRDRCRWRMIYAQSNDSDLHQLMDAPNFAMYRDDIRHVVSGESLSRLPSRMTPAELTLSSALQGTHNDIEGIPGVGPVRGMQAVRDPALMRKLRADHAATIDRNLSLIRLPHPELRRAARPPARAAVKFDQRALYRWLGRYDIDCTLSMLNAFEQISHRGPK